MRSLRVDLSYDIASETDLRQMFTERHRLAEQKCLDRLDLHAREFISRSPFLCLGTQNADGRADVSPRGDFRGFVTIIDDKLLAIPDRPGNNRLDSLVNILSNPTVGLLFIIPGFDETLRVNGRARINRDPNLLATMEVNNKIPRVAIIVQVEEVFLHCAKAFRRSKFWNASAFQDRKEMPTFAKIVLDQIEQVPDDPAEMDKIDQAIDEEYETTLY